MSDLNALSTIYVGEDSSLLTFHETTDFASEKKGGGKKKGTVPRKMVSVAFKFYFQEAPRMSQKDRSSLRHLYSQFTWEHPNTKAVARLLYYRFYSFCVSGDMTSDFPLINTSALFSRKLC